MDGYRGGGTYRPHAFFFWFLPLNERSGIPDKKKEQLVEDLYEGRVSPKMVLMDLNLRALSPKVTQFFEKNYEPVGVGVLWKRKR